VVKKEKDLYHSSYQNLQGTSKSIFSRLLKSRKNLKEKTFVSSTGLIKWILLFPRWVLVKRLFTYLSYFFSNPFEDAMHQSHVGLRILIISYCTSITFKMTNLLFQNKFIFFFLSKSEAVMENTFPVKRRYFSLCC